MWLLAVLIAPVLYLPFLLVDVGHVELKDVHVEEGLGAVSALQVEQVGNRLIAMFRTFISSGIFLWILYTWVLLLLGVLNIA